MNGESKNESFKLLQLSDDSKSLSDLELPEIATQRRRKVRRKTRPRTSSVRHADDRGSSHIDCKNFGLWLAVLMTVLWLFIISYITSVVHNENRRLEIAIQKVSATSQNVPEALQKWHETSKNLEQNQTALNGKLREIQQVLSNFSTELKQLRDTIEKKNENSQETQLNSLKTNVADLGSKIDDAVTRISALEEHYTTAQSEQKTLTKSVNDLQTLIAQIRNSSSPASLDGTASNTTEQNIANIREQLSTQIANLAQNFTEELQTLKQKNTWLNNDLNNHKKSIDELIENSANISSHVKSVENIWVEMKNNLSSVETDSRQLNKQIDLMQNVTNGLKGSLGNVQEECDRYHGQNEVLSSEISAIKERLEKAEKKEVPTTASTINATEAQKDSNLSQLFNNPPTQSTISKITKAANDLGTNKPADAEGQLLKKDTETTATAALRPSVAPATTSSAAAATTSTSPSKQSDANTGM